MRRKTSEKWGARNERLTQEDTQKRKIPLKSET